MQNPQGKSIELRLAIERHEHIKGLSGIKSSEFKMNEGMLFINPAESLRTFWMIDTYFNLDIIFLDSKLKIVGIEKNVLAHPGENEPPPIYRTQTYQSQFVLETKAHAPFSQTLKKGDQLKFFGKTTLLEIISKIHPKQ